MQICYIPGPVPVCPRRDLVRHFQIPTKKPKVGIWVPCLVLLVADAEQFSRAKENLKLSGKAPCLLVLALPVAPVRWAWAFLRAHHGVVTST